jgi:hypothetical protein
VSGPRVVDPFLFSADAALVAAACDERRPADERVSAVVVDWEQRGKAERQLGAELRIGTDTQIRADTPDDLARVRAAVLAPVICRINAPCPDTPAEVALAAALGADEVLVPMVRTPAEVEAVLAHADGRVGAGILIETPEAVACAHVLGMLPITRVYVGLMDLALQRGTSSIFTALVDGTVERVRSEIAVPFGFGGLTVPGGGSPLPTELLLGEMARLRCDFSFLRRSFAADAAGRDVGECVARIRRAARAAADRAPAAVEADRRRLVERVEVLDPRQFSGAPR